jgi:iron complex outermembrane receptor protein
MRGQALGLETRAKGMRGIDMSLKKLAAGAALTVLAQLAATGAFAQSTGTQTVGELVVTAHPTPLGGLVAPQDAPKTRDIVSQAYLSTQSAGANAMQVLNLVPGVNFTQDDPFGMTGSAGHISIRGLKGANIAEMEDGMPLNDAGNYAVYAGERLDNEVLDSVNVITGSSEVDAPSASSLGGTINYNTIVPSRTFGGMVTSSAGSFGAQRYQGMVQTGEVGPWGTRAFVEGSYAQDNKYTTGFGRDWKWQVNGKVYQDLHHEGDFAALAVFYDRQVFSNYDGVNFASSGNTSGATSSNIHLPATNGFNLSGLLATPWNSDYNQYFVQPGSASANTSFQGLQLNPTYTGNIRGQFRWTLLPDLKLTVDPSYQWILATGGTLSGTLSETDPLLIGNGQQTVNNSNYAACTNASGQITGIDLDGTRTSSGAPSCANTLRITNPSVTQTSRYTVNTDLIWTPSPQHLIQFAYSYDHANVRQTGDYAMIQGNGWPTSYFSGLQGWGTPILGVDGNTLERRNRLTIAGLDQVSIEYIGKFFDDHLRLDLGVRDPFIHRTLNQYCYTNPPATVYCTSYPVVASGTLSTQKTAFGVAPFAFSKEYGQPLPNVGATWMFDSANQVFIDYTQALNAPINDDLYSIGVIGVGGSSATSPGAIGVKPETSSTIEGGYRYQTSSLRATIDGYYIEDNNHIVSAFSQLTQDSVDTNVGAIHFWGIEGQAAWVPIDHLTLIGEFAYEHSEVVGNIPFSSSLTIPTNGKQFYDTPPWMVGGRAVYEWNQVVAGLQFKYVDARYVTAVNDLRVPSYTTVDMDLRYKLDFIKPGTYVQFNVINLFDQRYIGSINYSSSNSNVLPTGAANPYYSYPFAIQGTPRTVQGTLRFTF